MKSLELSSICRLCVQVFEKEKVSPIFNNTNYNDRISLPERIKYCSSIEVSEDDGLPPQICYDCLLNLDRSFVFRNQCVLADITLKCLKEYNFAVDEVPSLSKVDINNQIINSENNCILTEIWPSPGDFNGISREKNIDEFDNSKNGRHKRNIDKLKNISLNTTYTETLDSSEIDVTLKNEEAVDKPNNLDSEIVSELNVVHEIELNSKEKEDHELGKPNVSEIENNNNFKNVSSELLLEITTSNITKNVVEKTQKKSKRRKGGKNKASIYKCDHCEKVYPSEGGWRYHVHTMHNENYQPYICDLCGDAFKVKKNLVAHKNSIHFHLKHHLCDVCGRGFASKYSLKVHKSWHNDERNFSCDVCGTKFRTRGRLNSHYSIHGGPKKYMCYFCSREYRWKKDFEVHIRTHTGEKPFKCSCCGKAFSSSTNRKKHEKNHIKKDEFNKNPKPYATALPTLPN